MQVIFSQSRGNLLVCKELTLEKMKSANFNFPHNQFNSKESVVFFLLACDIMPSPFISVICFHKPKKRRSKRKITPDLRLSFCRPVASLFGCTIFSELRDWDSWALGYHESSDCFEHAQNSLLKSSHSKRTCQIFLPKKFHRSLLSLEIRSTPPLPFPRKKTAVKDQKIKTGH